MPHDQNVLNESRFDLRVDISLPKGMKPKERFWAGFKVFGADVVLQDESQAFLRFRRDGDEIKVFHPDGRVEHIVRIDGKIQHLRLTVEDQAALRIDEAKVLLDRAETYFGAEKAKRQDGAYHALIAILAIGGNLSRSVFDEVYGFLEDAARKGTIRNGVKMHMLAALKEHPEHIEVFSKICDAVVMRRRFGGAFGSVLQVQPTTDSNIATQRLAKRKRRQENLAKRAARNQAHVKGPTGSKDSNKKGKHKKK